MHEDEEDPAALFRAAVGEVAPLRKPSQPPPAAPRPRPARRAGTDEASAGGRIADHPDAVLLRGDASAFRRERLPARDWQRLRRGQFSAQDELDLHGANALQAEALLARFLAEAVEAGLGCVRIVHGKGGGEGVPVLKNLVDRWLRLRGEVLAFHSAPPAQGGTGALLVLLARR
ncbi:Smr/MutS family protein [Pseudoxanthomonas koreensis]|uniref:Smr/MutS family protein n=1 Tax=Pseudoxanthomonas koreensis TaxID=266061 RepID=UPI001390CE8D|nr:Smr/MutS family protein [Pseudoxanthomonas koreensis]KAF1690543.1 SMR domain protein [Pseudoxanthomonas koreensis]